jgi:DNA polymerase III subunit delta'
MLFKEVIGQDMVKEVMASNIKSGRVSHAQLFAGNKGAGGVPLAVAYARYVLCVNRQEQDACGTCPSCLKINNLSHPDLHFSFPYPLIESNITSDTFLTEWRTQFLSEPYFDMTHWLQRLDEGTKKPIIPVAEGESIMHKMSLKSYEGGYKILILWLPELMNVATANKLLKLFEEPPPKTLFLLVSNEIDNLLTTIVSRVQILKLDALSNQQIANYLISKYGASKDVAEEMANLSERDLNEAIHLFSNSEGGGIMIAHFIEWMRLCYQRDAVRAVEWVDKITKEMGREDQKNFLRYCLHMFRQCIVGNYTQGELMILTKEQREFIVKFAPFINANNIVPLFESLEESIYFIDRNGSSKLVLLDVTLKVFAQIKKVT